LKLWDKGWLLGFDVYGTLAEDVAWSNRLRGADERNILVT